MNKYGILIKLENAKYEILPAFLRDWPAVYFIGVKIVFKISFNHYKYHKFLFDLTH